MSLTGKEDISLSKMDVVESKQFASTTKKLVFAHKCSGGETGINLLSLTVPTELSANGFSNPSSAELAAAKMVFNKKSVKVRSSLSGELVQFDHYVIASSTQIQFVGALASMGAQPGEYFVVDLGDVPVNALAVADTRTVTRTYELAVGQTTLNLGDIYEVGANLDIGSQIGAIKVTRNGALQLRNVSNVTAAPLADGNYQEIDNGTGYGATIVFNNAPVGQSDSVVVEFGNQIVSGDKNYIAALETLFGGFYKLAQDAAPIFGNSLSTYLTANPSQVERRAFGDLVLTLQTQMALKANLSGLPAKKIGSDATAGSAFAMGAGHQHFTRWYASADAILTKLSCLKSAQATGIKSVMAIYSPDPTTGQPSVRMGYTNEHTTALGPFGSAAGGVTFFDLLTPVQIVKGNYYWLSYIQDTSANVENCFNAPSTGLFVHKTDGYASVPPATVAGPFTTSGGFSPQAGY